MIFNRAKAKPKRALPPRLARLVGESWWLLLVGLGLYVLMILVTYSKGDPGWSHSVGTEKIHNAGGKVGAWIADVLLYLFGLSAYWWALCTVCVTWWAYRRLGAETPEEERYPMIPAVGFLLLILASASFEALRLHSLKVDLPLAPGGMLGITLSGVFSKWFGFAGCSIALLLLMGIGFSLLTGMSWLTICEKVGEWLEVTWFSSIERWRVWQDRRIGEVAAQEREDIVAEDKKHMEVREPLRIEVPQTVIQKSERVVKEKQRPLFDDLPDSPLPPLHLLDEPPNTVEVMSAETLEYTSRSIEKKLLDFGVEVKVLAAYPGPVVTRYEVEPAVGVKGSQITNLSRDLARALSVSSIRVVENIPGKSCMGLEVPNPKRQIVRLSEILSSKAYGDSSSPLNLALGKDIAGKPIVVDLARMPHLLVAGTTGSGKSVAVNAMILSVLYKATPKEARLILVDPKMLELSVYEGVPHLLAPVVTDMKQAGYALTWCIAEMERRYKLLSKLGVRNLAGYNQKVRDAEKAGNPLKDPLALNPEDPPPLGELPLIVVVIDELADLMMVVGKKVEELIARLAQKARAAGIHLLLATQRPSVDVITGLIKANIPARIAFQVASKVDSRTILDQGGAEALLGQGDMLILSQGSREPERVHGAFVADDEVHRLVEWLKARGQPQYIEGVLTGAAEDEEGATEGGEPADVEADPMYDQAVEIVTQSRRASISLVQRHLRIGYNRAARLIEQMEKAGLVSSMATNGNREVLIPARD